MAFLNDTVPLRRGDDHEDVVFLDPGGQRRQLVPVLHLHILGAHALMVVELILPDAGQRVLAPMVGDAAVEILGQSQRRSSQR